MKKQIDAEELKKLLKGKHKEFTEKAKEKKNCKLQYEFLTDGLAIAIEYVEYLQKQ